MNKKFNSKIRDIIGNKIIELNPDFSCPFCKKEVFSIPIGETPTRIEVFSDDKDQRNLSLPTVHLVCSNCGYMSSFAAKLLIPEWDSLFASKTEGNDGPER